jgi:hypothetical protein
LPAEFFSQHQFPRPVQQIPYRLRRNPHLPGSLRQRLPFQNQPRCFARPWWQGCQIDFTRLAVLQTRPFSFSVNIASLLTAALARRFCFVRISVIKSKLLARYPPRT